MPSQSLNNFQKEILAATNLDIAVNKVQTIFERQEPKDVFDLYWILKNNKITLNQLFKLVEKKFGSRIDPITWSARAVAVAGKLSILKPLVLANYYVREKTIQKFFQDYPLGILRKKIK